MVRARLVKRKDRLMPATTIRPAMRSFSVILTRDVTESVTVSVKAAGEDRAKAAAMALDTVHLKWAVDDGNIWQQPYVTGVDEDADIDPEEEESMDAAQRHEQEQERLCEEYQMRLLDGGTE